MNTASAWYVIHNMHKILRRCLNCHQSLDEDSDLKCSIIVHESAYDCIRTLVKRVEALEYELLAKRLPDALTRSSDPGPPPDSDSIPIISDYPPKR